MRAVYARALPETFSNGVYNLYGLPEQPAVDGWPVAAVTNKVPYLLQFEVPVSATVADAALWPSIALHLPI